MARKRVVYQVGALLVVLALVLGACAQATPTPTPTPRPAPAQPQATPQPSPTPVPPTPTPTPKPEPIRIGTSLPLTGNFAIAGAKHRDGYQLCVDLINERGGLLGRPVEILVQDNRSDTETVVSQYERFINVDKVDLLFGTFSSLLTFPSSAVAERARMVYPVPSGGALRIWERGFKFIFYFQQNAVEYIGKAPVNMLLTYRDQGLISEDDFPKTAAVVNADDFFGNAIATGLLGGKVEVPGTGKVIDFAPGFLAEAGIEVVFSQTWPEGFSDWNTLANAIKDSQADALFAATASPDEGIELVRALKAIGYQPKFLYMSQGTQSEFYEALGKDAEGIVIHSSWSPYVNYEGLLAGERFTNEDFKRIFKERFGRDPDEDEAIPFAVCQGMEQAVRAVGSTDNAAIRDWLAARTAEEPVKTVLGDFHWDERGLPIGRDYVILQWQNGELKAVYPLDTPGRVDLLWPKPAWSQ